MISKDIFVAEGESPECSTKDSPRKATICGLVVTYQPDLEFASRIQTLMAQVAQIVVIDNGSSEACVRQLRGLENNGDIRLILNYRNEGVARALNQGVDWATTQGFDWILTMDQDSVVKESMVESLCAVWHEFPDKKKLAVIGSNYTASAGGKLFLAASGDNARCWIEVKTTITSGSLIPLSAFRLIGPFLEELFIDFVDFEYCLRARSKGFRVVMTRKPLMLHGIGNLTIHQLPWKTTSTSNHPPIRRYFMTRNQLALAKEYLWTEPRWTLLMFYRQFKAIALMCLFEKDVPRKLRYTALGMWDGLESNFSRIPKP
jgi:rhamnosyltransferase